MTASSRTIQTLRLFYLLGSALETLSPWQNGTAESSVEGQSRADNPFRHRVPTDNYEIDSDKGWES